ncbi:MAG: luciferase family protein, partial [Myxococcota bacterium]
VAEMFASWRAILSVGLPAVLTNGVVPVATAIMTWLVARHGAAAVAAYGVASRVEGLLLIAPMALSGALTPFVGQNYGAHHAERVARGIVVARNFVVAWGAGAWLLLLFAGGAVGGVFTDDPVVLEAVRRYLWIVPISYGANGLVSVASASFNAVDKAVRSTILAAVRSLLLAVPLAAVGSAFADLTGIFAGVALATILAAVLAYVWMRELLVPATRRDAAHKWEAKAPELTQTIEAVIDAIDDLDDVDVHPTRSRALGFFLNEHELGHVHRGGQLDLTFPPEVRDQLEREDKVEHHRLVHDSCWVTHRITEPSDVAEAVWLLRLSHAIRLLLAHGKAHDRGEEELSRLGPSDALSATIHAAVARAEQHRVRGRPEAA